MLLQSRDGLPIGAGIGLRLPHIAEVVATLPPVQWLEIHPENFLANPHATELLLDVRQTLTPSFGRSFNRVELEIMFGHDLASRKHATWPAHRYKQRR